MTNTTASVSGHVFFGAAFFAFLGYFTAVATGSSQYAILVGLAGGVGIVGKEIGKDSLTTDIDESASTQPTDKKRSREDSGLRVVIVGQGLWLAAWAMAMTGYVLIPAVGTAVGVVVVGITYLTGPAYVEIASSLKAQSASRESSDEQGISDPNIASYSSRIRSDGSARTYVRLFAASAVIFYVSLIAFAAYVFGAPEQLLLSFGHPIVLIPTLSWIGMVVSLCGYIRWSVRTGRRLRRKLNRHPSRNPVSTLLYVLALLNATTDDLSAYDKRVRRTVFSILGGIVVLLLPVGIFYGGS